MIDFSKCIVASMIAACALLGTAKGQSDSSGNPVEDCALLAAYVSSKRVSQDEAALIESCAKSTEWCEAMREIFIRNNRTPPAALKCRAKSVPR